jgi:hypothetical protein
MTTPAAPPPAGDSPAAEPAPPPEPPKPRRRRGLRILAWIAGVLLLGVVLAFVFIDAIAKAGIEKGATYALGVETSLGSADVGVFSGTFEMSGLLIDNPAGFEDSPHFLKLDNGKVDVSLGSLQQDVVQVPLFAIDGVDVQLISSGGKSNYGVILDNLSRFESKEEAPKEEAPPEEGGKKFVIREIVIRNVHVHADLLPIGGKLTRVHVPIDEIRLQDVGTGSDQGVSIADLSGILVKAILKAAVEKGGDLPKEIAGELNKGLKALKGLGEDAVEGVGKAGKAVIDEAGKAIKGIGDLFK